MSDPEEKTAAPPGNPTVRLDAVQILSELIKGVSAEVKASREETTQRFDRTDANIGIVANDLGVVKARVDILESERTKLSGGVRQLSTSDASMAAELAQTKTELAEEKTKHAAFVATAATKDDLKAVTKDQTSDLANLLREGAASSLGKKIITALGFTILAALGTATVWLNSKGHHETQAAPVFVPVLIAPDGGVLPR